MAATLPTAPDIPYVTSVVSPAQADVATAEKFNAYLSTVPAHTALNLNGLTIDAEEGPLLVVGRTDLLFLAGTVIQKTTGANVAPKTWLPRLHLNWPRNRAPWIVQESRRIQWVGPTVLGANGLGAYLGQLYEEQAAFSLRHSSDISIDSPKVQGVFGDVVSVVHSDLDATRSPCERVQVTGVEAEFIGRNLMSVVSGVDIYLNGAEVWKTGRTCFNIEPAVDANRCERIQVRALTGYQIGGALVGNLGGSNKVNDITLQDLRLADRAITVSIEGRTDRAGRRARYVIERVAGGGTSIANGVAVRISNVDDVTVRDVWQRCAGLLKRADGSTIYPGIGMTITDANGVTIERADFIKGKSAATTGDVTPYVLTDCTNVTAS